MNLNNLRCTAFYKGPVAVLSVSALSVGVMLPLAAPASAAPKKPKAAVTVAYPSTSDSAAGQAGEGFDLDVRVSQPGTLKAEIRATAGHHRQWIPLKLATEAPNQQVASGTVSVLAEAPAGTARGDYDLRVQLVDASGKVIDDDDVRRGVTIEDHRLPTGFETVDGTRWTTFEEEQPYLARLADRSPRATLTVLGSTVNGLPYNLLTIGAGAGRPVEKIDGDAVLLVCSQHGNEPAGRESCFQQARRLALTDDARTRDYLKRNTVLVIPSANPDGSMANTRQNAHAVDLNRDHLRLEEPETRMIAKVMRDARPEIVLDLHEMSGQTRPHLEVIWGRHKVIDEEVRSYGVSWGTEWVRPRTEAAGFTTGPYLANPGTAENVTLTNGAMMRNLNGVITETNTSILQAEGETLQSSQLRRVKVHGIGVHETLRQHRAERDEMARAGARADLRNVQMGYTQEGPYYFTGNSESSEPDPPGAFIMEVPCGYLLTAEQLADRADWLALFKVSTQKTSVPGYAAFVPMWQRSSAVIPLMFDARAAGSNEIEATPVDNCDGMR